MQDKRQQSTNEIDFAIERADSVDGLGQSRDTIRFLKVQTPKRIVMETIFGVQWRQFIPALRSGSLSEPFLVRETPPDAGKQEWYLYAKSPTTLVQVMTLTQTRRVWRTVDGALSDLERELGELPTVTVYGSIEAFALADGNDG